MSLGQVGNFLGDRVRSPIGTAGLRIGENLRSLSEYGLRSKLRDKDSK